MAKHPASSKKAAPDQGRGGRPRHREARRREARRDSVVVIGLGRFGSALALELADEDTEVLGIDHRAEAVQGLSGSLTHVVRADSTKEEVLRQLGVHEFERAVVGIGTDLEASILTASLLVSFGIPNVWAKAISEPHGRILTQLGVQHASTPSTTWASASPIWCAAGCWTTSSSRTTSPWSRPALRRTSSA
ncbi:potassium channel family protein [Streptomyces pini]|uniref:TrkA-N domain-containing protein n=1 Tax=Streptomyces pini TaxID=1520580 RepID=A0A1I3V9N9_9ACTN|nr:TrkA family potassium uptake protein [Streptomyces pini]SFJ91693.1 TrkA-N domain-containing protein [Streptomyces pini]